MKAAEREILQADLALRGWRPVGRRGHDTGIQHTDGRIVVMQSKRGGRPNFYWYTKVLGQSPCEWDDIHPSTFDTLYIWIVLRGWLNQLTRE